MCKLRNIDSNDNGTSGIEGEAQEFQERPVQGETKYGQFFKTIYACLMTDSLHINLCGSSSSSSSRVVAAAAVAVGAGGGGGARGGG